MRIIAIAGKVDSRVIAYPLARALSLSGLTALISDDGAYRRLYFGDELQGTVNGIDVSIGLKTDAKLKDSLNESGVPYDNMIIVTSGYIPPDVTGVIICKGIDKSIMSNDTDKEEEEEVKTKKSKVDTKEPIEVTDEKVVEDTPKKVKLTDDLIIPDGVPTSTVYISFETPPKDGLTAVPLKDLAIRYIYNCEERKELLMVDDKSFNKLLVKITSDVVGISQDELFTLMTRQEYITGGKVK